MEDAVDEDEIQATILFDDFTTAYQRGEKPSKEECLQRCPESQKQEIADAIEGFLFVDKYGVPHVKEETIQECLRRLHEIRDRKLRRK